MENLEELCRDLYAEYESLRDIKSTDIPKPAWLIAEQTKVIDPLFYERRLRESVEGIKKDFSNETESMRGDARQHIYRISRYAFMIAVGKRLEYERLISHRNIEEGYESGFDADLIPEIVFYRATINDQKVSELFYFLGTAYKGAGMDPLEATRSHLDYIRGLRTT